MRVRLAVAAGLASLAAVVGGVHPPTGTAAPIGRTSVASTSCDADRDPLPAGLAGELAARYPGRRFTVAVLDSHGCAHQLHPDIRITTASVVKLEVMVGVLLRAQREGRSLTATERQQVEAMITESADAPTSALWSSLGGAPAMEVIDAEFGLTDTEHASPTWGLTSTSASDQVHLLRQVWTGSGGPLAAGGRAEARSFLTRVVPSQRWGASAGVPAGWVVGQKNGFAGSRCCGWRLNSVGWVERPDGSGWAIAVLSDGWATEAEGVAAVHELAGRINSVMVEPSFGGPSADGGLVLARGAAGDLASTTGSGWSHGGGVLASDVDVVGPTAPGQPTRVVARGTDGQPYLGWWTGGAWGFWPLGGQCSSGPSGATTGADRIDVFCRGTDGQLWTRTWRASTGWDGWIRVGGLLSSDPDVASPSPAHPVQVFARGLDGGVWQYVWGGSSWYLQHLGGGCSSGPTAAYSGPDRLDVFCRGLDARLWQRTWRLAAGWSSWALVGGLLASDPDATGTGVGSPAQVVARGLDGAVWRVGALPSGWERLGAPG